MRSDHAVQHLQMQCPSGVYHICSVICLEHFLYWAAPLKITSQDVNGHDTMSSLGQHAWHRYHDVTLRKVCISERKLLHWDGSEAHWLKAPQHPSRDGKPSFIE